MQLLAICIYNLALLAITFWAINFIGSVWMLLALFFVPFLVRGERRIVYKSGETTTQSTGQLFLKTPIKMAEEGLEDAARKMKG